MTGTTHQMIALLSALWLLTLYPVTVGPWLGALTLVAIMVGALTPDLDQPTANMWRRLLGGRAVGNVFQWFSGGHRHFTHALIGILTIGYATRWIAQNLISEPYQARAMVIWVAYMVGYISHPLADTLTDHGVPWLWPLKINFKVPPGPAELRVTTGSFVETLLVRGGIVVAAVLLLINHWPLVVEYFR